MPDTHEVGCHQQRRVAGHASQLRAYDFFNLLTGDALLAMPLLFISDDGKFVVQAAEDMPWQIERLGDADTRAFGLTPGASTLEAARAHFSNDAELALIVELREAGSVEAFYQSVATGFVTGKMILTLETELDPNVKTDALPGR